MPWPTPLERFQRKYRVDPESGCWVWIDTMDRNGYGQFWFDGRTQRAHRAAHQLLVGSIPEDLPLDHLCRNRACVNPAHLEPVTNRENLRRGAHGSLVTICAGGHPYTDDTTYFKPNGTRCCRICRRDADRRYRQRKRLAARRAA